jgi:hypothetical protein
VHDIQNIPEDGISYSALLLVDFQSILRSCSSPHIARVRAILSWSEPPPTMDPEWAPYWGNVVDAHVQIPPGVPDASPSSDEIGAVQIKYIDTASTGTGLTVPGAFFVGGETVGPRCPFGGLIAIQGKAPPNASNVLYRILIWPHGDQRKGTPILSSFDVVNMAEATDTQRTPDQTTGYLKYMD